MPTRIIEIIDSVDKCQLKLRDISSIENAPYAALSYCWGGEQVVKCTTDTINTWLIEIPFGILPKTIQDSVTVCRRLAIRYLWIDSLCIVQDDTPEKSFEIAQMPHIYRNARLTIAAARARTVREGFLHHRTATEHIQDIFELPYCGPGADGSITLFRTELGPEPIDERAWTLQERLLSPRTLEFGVR